MPNTNPIRPTDDDARALGRALISGARFGALGVIDPQTAAPMVSRIAVGTSEDGTPVALISDLSHHTRALREHAAASLLVGEPGSKGDPLTHPRLTLQGEALFIDRNGPEHGALRARWLATHPKAKLYIDFADFGFVRLVVTSAYLNGGFGKAFVLTSEDLGLDGPA
ncbi:MAG: pyridoxamine 5'-phosphate oxidase family protein [Pseudomonadota bacterium]